MRSLLLICVLVALPSPAAESVTGPAGAALLTSVAQALALTPDQAAAGQRVHLQGRVSLYRPSWRLFFVQDRSGGIYIFDNQDRPGVRDGDWVEVEGLTAKGGRRPIVVQPQVRKITPPADADLQVIARPVPLESILTAQMDAQWVQFTGTVRQATFENGDLVLAFGPHQTRLRALIPQSTRPTNLVDFVRAEVSVRGVCTEQADERGRLLSLTLFATGPGDLKIVNPPAPDPFAVQLSAMEECRRLAGLTNQPLWVHVHGAVIHTPSDTHLHVQDETGGIEIQTDSRSRVQVGDEVEAVGFLSSAGHAAMLEDALIRTTTRGGTAQPTRVHTLPAKAGEMGGRLVRLEARLVERVKTPEGELLTVGALGTALTAELANTNQAAVLTALVPDSVVELTGIWLASATEDPAARPRLLLRAADDVRVLRGPAWWTPRRVLTLLFGLTGLVLLFLTWAFTLRRQVRRQTAQIRERLEAEVELHKRLAEASRRAGMAEVAIGVLHNVGNVLNSVGVSASLVGEQLRRSKIPNLQRATTMLRDQESRLAEFLTKDPKGKLLPEYLGTVADQLAGEQANLIKEMNSVGEHIEHIKEIVAMQQSYAKVSGAYENLPATVLVEDALRMNAAAFVRHDVQVVREFAASLPEVRADRHKVLQILINLFSNAKYAMQESPAHDKRLIIRAELASADRVRITVSDNGVGIVSENLIKIFSHGFTTRKDGHGFGLHSGANAAKEMGGSLTAHSDGVGRGATFTLELPAATGDRREDAGLKAQPGNR